MLGNLSGEAVTPEVPDAPVWAASEVVIATGPEPEGPRGDLRLAPWEARVHRREVAGEGAGSDRAA